MAVLFNYFIIDVASILCVIAGLIYYYLTNTFNFWERLNVPYIKPELIYGNMKDIIQFKKSHFEAFQEFYCHFKKSGHRFGGIFQLKTPVLLLCSAELAKDIFVKNFVHFHDREIAHDENFDPLSANLIALEGHKWKFLRSKLNPAFSSSKLKGMFVGIQEVAEIYVKMIEKASDEGKMMEMRNSFSRYSMNIIGAVAFGLQVDAFNNDSRFLKLGKKFFEPSKLERILQTIVNCSPRLYKLLKLRSCSKEVTDFFTGVVRDAMSYRKKNNIERNDFLDILMKLKEENEKMNNLKKSIEENPIVLSEGVITAQAFVFFIAGYETSASGMSSCLYELARHPEIQDKVFEEVEETIKKHGGFTFECVRDMLYLEQVLEETLRLYPPVGAIVRKCTKPYQIQGTEIVIPKGCQAFIPAYAFHYDPEYFPDPTEFRPDRFAPENKKNLNPYAYMPFGHGPRICMGARLAMMEMKLTLALIIKSFKISECEKSKPFKIDTKPFFMHPSDGIWVRFTKRQNDSTN